jgi:hypothetical protein
LLSHAGKKQAAHHACRHNQHAKKHPRKVQRGKRRYVVRIHL